MTKASKKAPYEIAADFGDMPPFGEYKWEEGDESDFGRYKKFGVPPERIDDPKERAAYVAWLKDKQVPPT